MDLVGDLEPWPTEYGLLTLFVFIATPLLLALPWLLAGAILLGAWLFFRRA